MAQGGDRGGDRSGHPTDDTAAGADIIEAEHETAAATVDIEVAAMTEDEGAAADTEAAATDDLGRG
jgi:hypothetical protein